MSNATLTQNATGTSSQSLPQSATFSQFMPVGLDVGNGAVKMVSSMGETLMESYIHYLDERDTAARNGYVEYLGGSRSDLAGKIWIGGINAYFQSKTGLSRVTDDLEGKAQLCLQLLLSALSQQHHRPEWHLAIVASVHDKGVLGAQIRQALDGTHKVRLQGKESIVTVRVARVVDEGSGVAVALRAGFDFTNAVLFDLGNGTAIATAFNGLQIVDRQYETNAGVEKLIDAIAMSDLVRKELLTPGDRHLIRTGIEKGDFTYGTRKTGWTFREPYGTELAKWLDEGLRSLVKKTSDRMASATAVIAVGGGSQLPGVKQLLDKRGIVVADNARWLNAKGLYQVAVREVK